MAITSARMQQKRGEEVNFDPDKMLPGEWAVSLDTKYVRMCFSPGVCVRMATYDAFEADMEQIREILAECQTVEEAVQRIYEDIKDVTVDVERIEAAATSALESEENALNSANSATQSANTATQKASDAAESANIASTKAEQATEGKNTATQKASEALNSAENAKLSENKAIENAKLSESYAVGGTGTRTGEDTDNSKYYSEVAKTESDKATTEADRAKAEADRAQGLVGGDFVTNSQIKEYSLIKDTGYELGLSIDNTNYVMTVQLKNANGSVLSEKSIDFPIESMVIDATYSNGVITLTLQNGTTLPVDVSALVSGLVKNTFTIAGIDMKDNITASELKKALGLNNVANVTVNNQAPTFTKASTRANIASGEKLSVLFGKIMKWFADLKTVAFSGSYNDLSNKPTIPTVNNATLTIQKNGSNVQTFTANASSNKTANIIVPTKTSELENDSGFLSSATALDTYEEIMANTESGKFAGAKGVKQGFTQLNDSLQEQPQFVYDESTGKITGYTTKIGGADTVFPFSNIIYLENVSGTVGGLSYNGWRSTFTVDISELYPNYANITPTDVFVRPSEGSNGSVYMQIGRIIKISSYDANTGTLVLDYGFFEYGFGSKTTLVDLIILQ